MTTPIGFRQGQRAVEAHILDNDSWAMAGSLLHAGHAGFVVSKEDAAMALRIALWDLDDTLYGPETHLFAAIREGSRKALYELEGVQLDAQAARQHPYVREYRTIYHGLVKNHPAEVEQILQIMFDIPVEEYLPSGSQTDALQAAFQACPLRHVLFTHAPCEFARRVLGRLGIERFFEEIFDGRRMSFQNKREVAAHQQVLSALQASGPECIMVDDSPDCLNAAHAAGMCTMLMTWERPEHTPPPAFIDYTAPTTLAALQRLRELVRTR